MNTRKFYQIDAHSLMIGTTNGTKKDAEMFVESQIERYFDIPKKCSYRLVKVEKEVFHFEIQDSSITGSVIDELLVDLEEEPSAKLLISTPEDIQYQVHRRSDGTLRTFMHADGEQIKPSSEDEIKVLDGKTSKLDPFFSPLTVAMWVSAGVFALSIGAASIAASISVSASATESDYKDAIASNPVAFATQHKLIDQYAVTNSARLPAIGGIAALDRHLSKSTTPVGKLEFRRGSWIAVPHQQEKQEEVKTK